MLNETVIAALQRTRAALDPLQIPVDLLGGIAVAMWGVIRATRDVDVILSIAIPRIDEVINVLNRAQIRSRYTPPRTIAFDGVDLIQFDCAMPGSFWEVRIDVQFAKSEYHRQLLDRRIRRQLPETVDEVDVVACEDLIFLKLLAGCVLDLADAAALIRYNGPDLDLAYMTRWARPLRLMRRLNLAWEEAFPGEAFPQRLARGVDDDA